MIATPDGDDFRLHPSQTIVGTQRTVVDVVIHDAGNGLLDVSLVMPRRGPERRRQLEKISAVAPRDVDAAIYSMSLKVAPDLDREQLIELKASGYLTKLPGLPLDR